MSDRRLLVALALIMVIAFLPMLVSRRPPIAPVSSADTTAIGAAPTTAAGSAQAGARSTSPPPQPPPSVVATADSGAGILAMTPDTATSVAVDTVVVRSPLYRFGISTRGGRIISSQLLKYLSLAPGTHGDTLELLPTGTALLGGTLVAGTDTLRLDQVVFTANTDSLTVPDSGATVTLEGSSGSHQIELRYTFEPDAYRIRIAGRITDLPAAGGTLLVGLGNGFLNTESDSAADFRQSGVVTKQEKTKVTLFSKLTPRTPTTMSGPFEWAAVKSQYFVAAIFAYDSTAQETRGNIGGVEAYPADTLHRPVRARVAASISVPSSGQFHWAMYIGPMEYHRLAKMGHQFDDVNPYGWAWLRWMIRPFAVYVRAIFVWMHEVLHLGYGLVIVVFGLAVRILIWPLSRIAMRSMARMQMVQPLISELQKRHKDNPQLLQQETFKLYKEHKVNPFGGCWPMLLPYPVLVAVFFVLEYAIEVRGVSFLWMPDLARMDPLYITPILMAVSMFAVSKIGQMGLPPNPQSKWMTWLMPGMMLVLFARFASGVNLYYAVQNIASIPQQWLVMKERETMQGKGKTLKPVVGVKTKGG